MTAILNRPSTSLGITGTPFTPIGVEGRSPLSEER